MQRLAREQIVLVQAQGTACGPYADIAAKLASKYGESPILGGTMPAGELVVWINADTQTWTVLIVAGEIACIRAAGTGLDLSPAQPLVGEGA